MKLVFTMTGTETCPGEENLVLIHQRQKRKRERERKKKQARKKRILQDEYRKQIRDKSIWLVPIIGMESLSFSPSHQIHTTKPTTIIKKI